MKQRLRIANRGPIGGPIMKTKYVLTSVWLVAVVMALGVQGCTFGKVISIQAQHPVINVDQPQNFFITGKGQCSMLRVKFGDGQSYDYSNHDFDKYPTASIPHYYYGWGGTKIVTAEGITNCVDKAQTTINVQPMKKVIAICFNCGARLPMDHVASTTTNGCGYFPDFPMIKQKSIVHITAVDPPRIDFGCLFGGCIYNANGENASAPLNFPVPGKNKYSLVIRIGGQVIQGGTDVTFTSAWNGTLEFCVNDDNRSDNSGGWRIEIEVDESGL